MRPSPFTLVLFLATHVSWAQWAYNGIPVSNPTGQQLTPSVCLASDSSVLVVWADYRSGGSDVFLQAYTRQGTMRWTTNGLVVCSAPGDQINPVVCSDGSGGAMIAWEDYRSGSTADIYAQRVSSSGSILWQLNGVPVCSSPGMQQNPALTATSGGVVIAWEDHRGAKEDLYAQRMSVSGSPSWANNGILVATIPAIKLSPRLAPDGYGGAIIVWEDYRKVTESDLYAQRLMSNGILSWGSAGKVVCASDYSQTRITVAPSDSGSVVIAWEDYRANNSGDIYSQRLSVAGTPLWTLDGVAVCSDPFTQLFPAITSDGFGGAIIAWQDFRGGSDIYAQRVHASGVPLWSINGEAICSNQAIQEHPSIFLDGSGGAIIAWTDYRNTIGDIFAQRISSSGWQQWAANGIGVCLDPMHQQTPLILDDGSGGAMITWTDYRAGNGDIYAQRIMGNGIALPVELLRFSASILSEGILLSWSTAREENLYGFELWASTDGRAEFQRLGFTPVRSPLGAEYDFLCRLTEMSVFRLRAIDLDGTFSDSPLLTVTQSLPRSSKITCAPLPVSAQSLLRIERRETDQVTITLVDVHGRTVKQIHSGSLPAGVSLLPFNASNLSAGTYVVHLSDSRGTATARLPVVR